MANTIYHELIFAIMIKYKILDLKKIYVRTDYDWSVSPARSYKYLKDLIDIDSYIEDYSQETQTFTSDLKEFITLMNKIENEVKRGAPLSEIYSLRTQLYAYALLPLPPIPTLCELASSVLFFTKNRNNLLNNKSLPRDLVNKIISSGKLYVDALSHDSDSELNSDSEVGNLLHLLFRSIKNPSEELNSQIFCAVINLNLLTGGLIQRLSLRMRPLSLNINYSKSGFTPLHMAAEACDSKLCNLLIELKADVNMLTDDSADEKYAGVSPLATAVESLINSLLTSDTPRDKINRTKAIIEILLRHGANPNLEGQQGYSAMNCIASSGQLVFYNTTDENKMILKDIVSLLINRGGNIDKLIYQPYKDLINRVLRYHPTPASDETSVPAAKRGRLPKS